MYPVSYYPNAYYPSSYYPHGGGALTSLRDGVIGSYTLNRTRNDVSGAYRHFDWVGTPAYAKGTFDQGAVVTRTPGNYLRIPPSDPRLAAFGSLADGFCATCWVRFDELVNKPQVVFMISGAQGRIRLSWGTTPYPDALSFDFTLPNGTELFLPATVLPVVPTRGELSCVQAWIDLENGQAGLWYGGQEDTTGIAGLKQFAADQGVFAGRGQASGGELTGMVDNLTFWSWPLNPTLRALVRSGEVGEWPFVFSRRNAVAGAITASRATATIPSTASVPSPSTAEVTYAS